MKHSVPHHPKTKRLKRLLGIPLWQALGILESLWQLTSSHAEDGSIGRWSDDEIADWLEYDGDVDSLIEALVQARFLDRVDDERRLIVHDWEQHCPEFVRKRLSRNGGGQRQPVSDNGSQCRTTADNGGHCPPVAANGCPTDTDTDTDTDTNTKGIVESIRIDHLDFSEAFRLESEIASRLTPRSAGDRLLAWRCAVLVSVGWYSENWLQDSLAAVKAVRAKKPWAYFQRCLREHRDAQKRDFKNDCKRVPTRPKRKPAATEVPKAELKRA